ncbi:MAG: Kelch repeat-containing protein [Geminicoccaceae bacterium]
MLEKPPCCHASILSQDRLVLTRRAVLISSVGFLASIRHADAGSEHDPWSIATLLPFAVQEIYPVAFSDCIVLAGGIVDDPAFGIGASARTIIYLPGKAAWIDGPDLPTALHHPGLVALPDRVFAIGGFVANADGFWQMQTSVFTLDRDFKRWEIGPDLPAPRAEFVAAHVGGQVVIVGGRTPAGANNRAYDDHIDVDATLLFDPQTDRWHQGRPAPTARNSAAGAVLGDMLHIVGGRISTGAGIRNLDVHEVYDPATDRWSARAPMPQAQGGLAAAAFDDRLYVFGGEFFGARSGVYKEAWVYDPVADIWQAAAPMPLPRHGLGALALEDGVHVIGGAARAGAEGRSDRHDVFRPN